MFKFTKVSLYYYFYILEYLLLLKLEICYLFIQIHHEVMQTYQQLNMYLILLYDNFISFLLLLSLNFHEVSLFCGKIILNFDIIILICLITTFIQLHLRFLIKILLLQNPLNHTIFCIFTFSLCLELGNQ